MDPYLTRFLICAALIATPAYAMIGGRDVPDGDPILRHFVGLSIASSPRGPIDQCSGVLITARHVLTAGHCLTATAGDPRAVTAYFFGAARLITTTRSAVATAVHPDFQSGRPGADLAVVTLTEDAPPGFAPIALALDDAALRPGALIEVAGVGLTNFRKASDEWRLKLARLTYDHAAGPESWLKRGSGGVPCLGDSGGPAFVRDRTTNAARLVGIQTDYTFYADTNVMTGAMMVHPSHYAAWLSRAIALDAPRPVQNARGF